MSLRLLCLALSAAIALGSAGCAEDSDAAAQQGPPTPTVTVAQPLVRQIVEWDAYTGRLEAIDEVRIQAKVSGYLQDIHFRDGQLVKAGDLLFTIQQRPFQSEVDRATADLAVANANVTRAEAGVREAEASLDQAKAAYVLAEVREGRARRLEDRGAVAQEELDQRLSEKRQAAADVAAADAAIELAKAQVEVASSEVARAESSLRTANIQLGYTTIEAPIDGRVSRRRVSVGDLVNGGTTGATELTTIVSVDPVYAYFVADEQQYRKYVTLDQQGKRASSRDAKNPVLIGLVDEDGFPHEGYMNFVDNRVDENTGTMTGRAIFPNPTGDLTPGLFARVRLPGSAPYDAVLVPEAALATDQVSRFVYVIESQEGEGQEGESQEGTQTVAVRRPVEVGPARMGLRIIRDGLDGSERIVIDGLQTLRPGMPVKVADEPGTIEADEDADGLPNDYEPWPRDRWVGPDAEGETREGETGGEREEDTATDA